MDWQDVPFYALAALALLGLLSSIIYTEINRC